MKHKILVKLAVVLIMISVSFVYYFVKNYANDPIIMDHETGGNQVNSENPVPEVLIVDISGEVINPQILELKKSSRVYEAINKAGGL
ncbi:MAG: SLBB domain-containing protein, partial [Peptostreptococcales bacterium]